MINSENSVHLVKLPPSFFLEKLMQIMTMLCLGAAGGISGIGQGNNYFN